MQNSNPSTTNPSENDPARNLDPIAPTSKADAICKGLPIYCEQFESWHICKGDAFQLGVLASIVASLTHKDRGRRESAKKDIREIAKLGGWK